MLWDGLVDIEGDAHSPTSITIRNPENPLLARPIALPLQQVFELPSWGSVVDAYEAFVLAGDEIDHDACAAFMSYLPQSLENGGGPPSELYREFRRVGSSAGKEIEAAKTALPPNALPQADRLLEFWAKTVQGALRKQFEGTSMAGNHEKMFELKKHA